MDRIPALLAGFGPIDQSQFRPMFTVDTMYCHHRERKLSALL